MTLAGSCRSGSTIDMHSVRLDTTELARGIDNMVDSVRAWIYGQNRLKSSALIRPRRWVCFFNSFDDVATLPNVEKFKFNLWRI